MKRRPVERVSAVVPAAGAGRRLAAGRPKAFVSVGGKPLLVRTLENLRRSYSFLEIVAVVSADRIEEASRVLRRYGLSEVRLVRGGATRSESVRNGLHSLSPASRWVLVHDGARPFVTAGLVRRVLDGARKTGAAIPVEPVSSTVKSVDGRGFVRRTIDRSTLALAQTPQVARRDLLEARYRALGGRALAATDEAALFDGTRVKVRCVPGDPGNVKITVPADLKAFK